jgi:hypothetical protein
VDLTIADGLFDIVVNAGTSVSAPNTATVIRNSGTIGGPARQGGTDNHVIYMVAVPKNQAISMALSGSVGFAAATSATVENGQIILSSGYGVSGRAFTNQVGTGRADVSIQAPASFSSDVTSRVVRDFRASGGGTGVTFAARFVGASRQPSIPERHIRESVRRRRSEARCR